MATLSDVARRAGVSPATASRVINGSSKPVTEDLRERVLRAAADDLRYRDFLTVALVVPDLLPGQLDLRPRPGGAGRPDPELRVLVTAPGQ